MTAASRGRCACGAIRFRIVFPTRFVCHCHCDNCRRAHGAAFVTWAGVARERFELGDDEDLLAHWRTDTGATRSFCSRCGTTLTYESPRWEGEVHVAVAHLDDPLDRAPSGHVYADRAPAWAPIHDDLPRHGGASGTEPLSS